MDYPVSFTEAGLEAGEAVGFELTGQLDVTYECLAAGAPQPVGTPDREIDHLVLIATLTAGPDGSVSGVLTLHLPKPHALTCPNGSAPSAFEGNYSHVQLADKTYDVVVHLPDASFMV